MFMSPHDRKGPTDMSHRLGDRAKELSVAVCAASSSAILPLLEEYLGSAQSHSVLAFFLVSQEYLNNRDNK